MVVTLLPSTADTGVTQERTAWPSMCTVQAPHSAIPQPNFVPVSCKWSRMAHNSGMLGSMPACATLAKIGNNRLRDGHHAKRVGLEDLADRLLRSRLERRHQPDPGVVDHGVEPTERGDGIANRDADRLPLGHVEPEQAEPIGRREVRRLLRRAHRRDDVPSVFEEVRGRGAAVPAARPGA